MQRDQSRPQCIRPAILFLAPLFALLVCLAPTNGFAQDGEDNDTYTIGALGDSITAGFNALNFADNWNFSWSTGYQPDKKVYSHFLRIKDLDAQKKIRYYTPAFVGAQAESLADQTRAVMRYRPDYVTILIGANDICKWSADYEADLAKYQDHVQTAIETIVTKRPDVKILLIPIPDIYQLYDLAKDRYGANASCRAEWDRVNICGSLLGRDLSDDERKAFRDRWSDANQTLEIIAGKYSRNVIFVGEAASEKFKWEDISSWDCFHPSIEGQNTLSERTWNLGWFQ